jgi:transposase
MTMKEELQVAEAKIEELTTLLSQALARISELEELVRKLSIPKTSRNSSKPPSSDIARKNQSLRNKSGKSPGGQKGHRGYTLKMTDTPDIKEELRPDYCTLCGVSLAGAEFELEACRQVIDIQPIVPIITEYQSFATDCTCGHHACGAFPEGVTNHVQYGKNLQSLIVYQSYFQFLPFARLQDFLKKFVICQ